MLPGTDGCSNACAAIATCRGKARRVSMRSLGWDMKVNIDGIYSVPLDYGVQAVMKIVDEPKYVLRTVDFSPLPGSAPKKKIF